MVEGNATTSAVLRLPGLTDAIGPVKSNALRIARRFTNSFRAGVAVETYEELSETGLLLIHVPDKALRRIVEELCGASLPFTGMSIAACETWQTSEQLAPLRAMGASVATVYAVPGPTQRWFVAEGDKPAVRGVKRLLEQAGARVLNLREGSKPLYFAAEHLATVGPLPLLQAAQTLLREAGISGRILSSVLDRFTLRMMKNFRAGNRLALTTPFDEEPRCFSEAHLEAIEARLPEVTRLVTDRLAPLSPALRGRSRLRTAASDGSDGNA